MAAPSMSPDPEPDLPPLLPERPQDAAAVDRLIMAAFGPGRFAKAAERVREGGRTPAYDVSFLAWDGERVIGCVQMWPVRIGDRAALLLGPFAVEPGLRSQGLGAALVRRACEAAAEAGHALVVLVGDEPYFGPLGFSAAAAAKVRMPGPADQRRVLVLALKDGADAGLEGMVLPV